VNVLRPYQQEAHDAVMAWVKKTLTPCLVEAPTGSGKSLLIAELAHTINVESGKHILALAPSGELLDQNVAKYRLTGNQASIFSASRGEKCLKHSVVFGTPMTVKNSIAKFSQSFAMIILDEAHQLTPTVFTIIKAMRERNPNIRIVGMTATPFRMRTGYIYKVGTDDKLVEQTVDPFFEKLVYKISAHKLIDEGYLTLPVVGEIGLEHYDTIKMELNARGQFDAKDVEQAYLGDGRKTAFIIYDIIERSKDRKGVMIFASTVQHAMECMRSLPPHLSAIITGETKKKDRANIIRRFKNQQIKYIVNVAVLTVGFDAPHADVIVLMRLTESVGLLQQIIGRGLRINPGKDDCLVLDYAENIDRHCPDGDIFDPKIEAYKPGAGIVECECEHGHPNEFAAAPNPSKFTIDTMGYFCDLDGNRMTSEWGDIPAHYGRRCTAIIAVRKEGIVQCSYRWTSKECPHCAVDNDITARYCISCKKEIIDPNVKLKIDFKAKKKDARQEQTDVVLVWKPIDSISTSGNPMYAIDIVTPYRAFKTFVVKNPKHDKAVRDLAAFQSLAGKKPETITYKKDDSGFFKILSYNRPPDMEPTV
jgi:DNA repair protein RadD